MMNNKKHTWYWLKILEALSREGTKLKVNNEALELIEDLMQTEKLDKENIGTLHLKKKKHTEK